MKNATPSSLPAVSEEADYAATELNAVFTEENTASRPAFVQPTSPALVFVAVSVACAVAAIGAGSYALWLTRQKAARDTLSSVQDLLKICQDRMHQMEDDLNLLPAGLSPTG